MRSFRIKCESQGIISTVNIVAQDLHQALDILHKLKPNHKYSIDNPTKEDILEIMESLKEV